MRKRRRRRSRKKGRRKEKEEEEERMTSLDVVGSGCCCASLLFSVPQGAGTQPLVPALASHLVPERTCVVVIYLEVFQLVIWCQIECLSCSSIWPCFDRHWVPER